MTTPAAVTPLPRFRPLPVQSIRLDLIDVPVEYQRRQRKTTLDKILATFDPAKAGVLYVAGPTADGRYRVWDGGHRLTAMKQLGVESWLCQISPPSITVEAEHFDGANTVRTSPKPWEIHRARLTAGTEPAAAVDAIVRRHGWSLLPGEDAPRIDAMKTLYDIAERWGTAVLDRTLDVATDAWRTNRDGVSMPMLFGISAVLGKHGDDGPNGQVDVAELTKRLRRFEPTAIRSLAKLRYSGGVGSGTKGHDVYLYIVEQVYNAGRRSKRLTAY